MSPHFALGAFVAPALALAFATTTQAGVIAGTGEAPGTTNTGRTTATRLAASSQSEGHILIAPYFNAQSGNATLFSVTNTDLVNGKVVKLRWRGAVNGDSMLSMLVMLRPGDVYTLTLTQGPNGTAQIATDDTSCTVPRMQRNVGQPLLTARLDPSKSATEIARQTREGYLEVQNVADIPPKQGQVQLGGAVNQIDNPLFQALFPLTDPNACPENAVQASIQTDHTSQSSAAANGLASPTGGLTGRWTIINVPRTTTFSGTMHAIRAVDDTGANARANFVLFPQTDAVLPSSSLRGLTTDPLLSDQVFTAKTLSGVGTDPLTTPAVQAAAHDLPDLSTPYVVPLTGDAAQRQAALLSAALAASSIKNDFALDASVSARTDWVISLPARRYSVAANYQAAGAARKRFSLVPATGNQYFHSDNISGEAAGQQCTPMRPVVVDRVGYARTYDAVFTGSYFLSVCNAVTVLRWAPASESSGTTLPDTAEGPLGDSTVRTMAPNGIPANGWALVEASRIASPLGLPFLGGSFIQGFNPLASAGMSGTYGLTYEHVLGK